MWPQGPNRGVGSVMNFADMNVEDIIKTECFDDYRQAMDFFWVQLTRLNSDLFIAEKIARFPFDFFTGPMLPPFFFHAFRNAVEISVLQIVKLVQDTGSDVFGLRRFKNDVLRTYIRPEYEPALRQKLSECRFDDETERLLNVARVIRDGYIAHFLRRASFNLHREDALTIHNLQSLAGEINGLFTVIAFGPRYRFLPLEYDPTVSHATGEDPRPDIERVLDSFARDCDVLHLPERNPIAWEMTRSSRPEAWINQLNRWRTRLGLPEA